MNDASGHSAIKNGQACEGSTWSPIVDLWHYPDQYWNRAWRRSGGRSGRPLGHRAHSPQQSTSTVGNRPALQEPRFQYRRFPASFMCVPNNEMPSCVLIYIWHVLSENMSSRLDLECFPSRASLYLQWYVTHVVCSGKLTCPRIGPEHGPY